MRLEALSVCVCVFTVMETENIPEINRFKNVIEHFFI